MWDTISSIFKGTLENVTTVSERLISGKKTCLKIGFATDILFSLHHVTLYALILLSVLSVFVAEWRNQFLLGLGMFIIVPCGLNILFMAADVLTSPKNLRTKPPSKPSIFTDLRYHIIQIPRYAEDTLGEMTLTANKGHCSGYILNLLTQKLANTAKINNLLHLVFATVSLAVLYGCVGITHANVGSYLVELWIMYMAIALLLPKKRIGRAGLVVPFGLVAISVIALALAEFEVGQTYSLVSDIPFCLFMLYYVLHSPLGICTDIRHVLRKGQSLRATSAEPILYDALMSSLEAVYLVMCVNRRLITICLISFLGLVGLIIILFSLKNGIEFGPILQSMLSLIARLL